MNNGKRPSDKDMFDVLDTFDAMMQVMVRNGVKFHSFQKHVTRMYVAAAVKECKGNYCKAAEKIALHRNSVTRIMNGKRVEEYGQAVQSEVSRQAEGD